MVVLAASFGVLLGLIAGSFINVIAHRIPLGVSVVRPRSACPRCGHQIRGRDNVPVASWFLLRGRCRDCGEPISARYPLVEAATAVLFSFVPVVIGVTWELPAYWCFAGIAVALVLTDLDHHRIPNRILFPGTLVATALLAGGAVLEGNLADLVRAGAGGGAFFGLLFAIALIARGGFGFGDVKLAFLLGEFLAYRSWRVLIAGIALSFLAGGLVALVLLALGRRGRKDAIAFGPSMVVGAFVALVMGQRLADWYFRT